MSPLCKAALEAELELLAQECPDLEIGLLRRAAAEWLADEEGEAAWDESMPIDVLEAVVRIDGWTKGTALARQLIASGAWAECEALLRSKASLSLLAVA